MKKSQSSISIFVLFFILTFVFYSCTKEKLENMVITPEGAESLKKNGIGTDAYAPIIKYESIWRFDHYFKKDEKMLIIWPESGANLFEYRIKYGFKGIIISANISNYNYVYNSCGYDPENIIVALSWYKSMNEIKNEISNVHSSIYYLDESLDQYRFTKYEVLEIANYITNLYPTSKLLLGSFNNPYGWYLPYVETFGNAYKYILNNNVNVIMMCDQYYGDQRYLWEKFKNYYNTYRVFGHFIHSKRDDGEIIALLNKANDLGVKNLCLFHGDDGCPNKTSDFCNNSWIKYWLRKYERKYIYEYRCSMASEGLCDEMDGWELYNITSTYEYREVFP